MFGSIVLGSFDTCDIGTIDSNDAGDMSIVPGALAAPISATVVADVRPSSLASISTGSPKNWLSSIAWTFFLAMAFWSRAAR